MNDTKFSVLDMANDLASSTGSVIDDLFIKDQSNKESVKQKESSISEPNLAVNEKKEKKKAQWMPDAEIVESMPEFNQAQVTYDISEIGEDGDKPLVNIVDNDAIESHSDQKDEMARMIDNIEKAKTRAGIIKFQIPPGPFQARIYNAASDVDSNRAAAKLDKMLAEIIEDHKEFILEWDADHAPQETTELESNDISSTISDEDSVKVVIDKKDVPNLSWSKDEIDKIRKARTVELNIVEAKNIEFGEIDEADQNVIDNVISQYLRRNNDIVASLPASRYRCTFTGLSYPEVLDLSNSVEMNNIDGERKKWSICFNHMKNMSIGEWKEYSYYIDPETGVAVMINANSTIPDTITPDQIQTHTKFDDFLQHTSFLDLNFMIWKILCATCMNTEIIQIDCHAKTKSGAICNTTYDWIYSPSDLLEIDSVDESVLEEMKTTGEVSGKDDVMRNYMESFLMKNRTAKLPFSGLYVVFGHISAYDYLDKIYPAIMNLENEGNDPSIATRGLNYTALTVVKAFMIKKSDGRYASISDTEKMVDILANMGEVDWQSIGEIVRMVMEPYEFRFSVRDLVCPKCGNKSKIVIENMTRLLFLAARSLSSVQVTFKTT